MFWPRFLGCFGAVLGLAVALLLGSLLPWVGICLEGGGGWGGSFWGCLWAVWGLCGVGLRSLTLSVSPSSAAAPGERWGGPGCSPRWPPASPPRPAPPHAGAAPAALPGVPQHGEVRPRPQDPIGPFPGSLGGPLASWAGGLCMLIGLGGGGTRFPLGDWLVVPDLCASIGWGERIPLC